MTDREILSMLTMITPEDYSQWKKLKKCVSVWMNNKVDYCDGYVSKLSEVEVVDRECSEVYDEYKEWCGLNYITEVVHINAFSKYINYYFNAKSKSVNGKRYYCKL